MRNLSRVAVLFLIFLWLGTAGIFSTNFIFATDKVEINTASLQQLDEITGIGPVLAQRIIDARPFSSVDDLIKVKGIGEKTLQKIKDQGLAYIDEQAEQTAVEESVETPAKMPAEVPAEGPAVKIYASGILINEILPSPEGADDQNEWIEIFNQNNFEVLLSDWKITDTVGKITTYSFPKGTKIPPQGFLVLSRPTTKITLNNDGDGLKLIQPDGKLINEVNYEKAPRGGSYNRTESGWAWSTNLTPGAANFIPFPQPEEKTETESLKDKSVTEPETKRELAAIGEQISKPSKSLFILLIALSLAIFSGIIILVLKKKLSSTRAAAKGEEE